ncbi:MAG: endonuclease/exonuclease/phosphatase family protein, partial [bacterium]|nr:endonuclease/exonuclease/phosphatase family protein [bacterium]
MRADPPTARLADAATPARDTAHLRVATLNVWGLWDAIGRHLRPRMHAIAAHAGEISLDVLGIQESWTEQGRDWLVAGLREAGLPHVWHNPGSRGGSGLVLFSRLPLREVRFQPFRLSGLPQRLDHADWYGGKGAVVITLDTSAGPVDILDTHLVAHYTPDAYDTYFGHRVGQVIEIAKLLSDSERPVIALGDFNLREDGPEYPILTGLSGLVDAAVALDTRFDTILAPHPYREIGEPSRIDYVWTRDGLGTTARVQHLKRAFDQPLSFDGVDAAYSDHAGLVAEIALSREVGARPFAGADEPAFALAREAL